MSPLIENEVARRLGVQYPILQGPFGGNLSTVELVSAVSSLGGTRRASTSSSPRGAWLAACAIAGQTR